MAEEITYAVVGDGVYHNVGTVRLVDDRNHIENLIGRPFKLGIQEVKTGPDGFIRAYLVDAGPEGVLGLVVQHDRPGGGAMDPVEIIIRSPGIKAFTKEG